MKGTKLQEVDKSLRTEFDFHCFFIFCWIIKGLLNVLIVSHPYIALDGGSFLTSHICACTNLGYLINA